MTIYKLPDLDYDYSALEPYISGEIMELHHDKHHAAYVKGANTALEQMAEAREKGTISSLSPLLSKNLAFNLGGHTNHSIFWKNLSPTGGGNPDGDLLKQIQKDFGSLDGFINQFKAAALTLQGSGWAVLAWDSLGKTLVVQQMTDQQGNISIGLTPLLMLDMWEHAFYLQYKNVKADYVEAFWNVVHWKDVAERYTKAIANSTV